MGETDPRFNEGPSHTTVIGGTTESANAPDTELTSADTGLKFGIGQSTSTGTLPTQGGANLDGTAKTLDTISEAMPDLDAHSSMDDVEPTETDALLGSPDPLMMDDHDPEIANVPEDDRETFVDKDGHRSLQD